MSNQLAYINLIIDNRDQFAKKVIEIATRLGIQANWLMVVFFIETDASRRGKIDHRIVNSIGATGLLQFMPETLTRMGTTGAALRVMSNVQQLDIVEKYLKPYMGRMKSLADVYLAVLFPAAIGKPDSWTLEAGKLTAEKMACANPLYDLNRDKKITVGEVKTKLKQFIPAVIS